MSSVKKSLDRSKLEHEYKPSALWPSLRKEDAKALALQYDAQQGKARNKLRKKGETESAGSLERAFLSFLAPSTSFHRLRALGRLARKH